MAVTLTLLISGFVFFSTRTGAVYRSSMLQTDAERMPINPLLVVQALILFFLGTGQVAGGITAEADEGTLDYQRLTPMTPLAKVLGCWLGLPVREWIMFAVTLPFSAWCMWRGHVPFESWASIYAAFITSALMYHLTGLTAGTVIKNRRWAFLGSIGLVMVLYTVMPQVSHFGLLFFDYLTVWPVFDAHLPSIIPREAGSVLKVLASLFPKERYFNLEFSELFFTLCCQAALMSTLGVMVWRRWRRAESHLLGKAWAVGAFAFIQVVLLGNGLPLIEPGKIFPSQSFGRQFIRQHDWTPAIGEAVSVISIYGFVTLGLMLVLCAMVTPAIENQLRGLRRARKLGLPGVPRFTDHATSFPIVLLMAAIGSAGWYWFAHSLMASKWFPGQVLPPYALLVFALVLFNAALSFHALMEGFGGRVLFLWAVLVWIVPLMVGTVLGIAGDKLLPVTTWLSCISPLASPGAATATLITGFGDLPGEVARAIPRAFWFWQVMSLLVLAWLMVQLRVRHRTRYAQVMEDGRAG